ncbi:hypothetical protein BVX98_02940 [bacterium F11]|nr:hypothetical protein BVX98_02940 [bacterium F11]
MKPRRHKKRTLGQLMILVAMFISVGVLLFLYAWFPVQAQRKLKELQHWEAKVSREKTLLQNLSHKYGKKTSLLVLDQWASSNGSWRSPSRNDVIVIHE